MLFESRSKDDVCTGRTARNELVHVPTPTDRDPIGHVLRVQISRANKFSLLGSFLDPDTLPLRSEPTMTRPYTGDGPRHLHVVYFIAVDLG